MECMETIVVRGTRSTGVLVRPDELVLGDVPSGISLGVTAFLTPLRASLCKHVLQSRS